MEYGRAHMENLNEYLRQIGVAPCSWGPKYGIATSVISRYFEGHWISLKNIMRMAKASGLSLEQLTDHYTP